MTLAASLTFAPGAAASEVAKDFEFGYFSGETYNDAFETMVDYNGAAATEEFFTDRLASGESAADIFPGFGKLSNSQQIQILEESAAAAGAPATLDPKVAAIQAITMTAVPAATVVGSPTADRRAWKTNSLVRYNWATCDPLCHVDDWYEIRHTVNPGPNRWRTDITLIRWGTRLSPTTTINAVAYANGVKQNDEIAAWTAPGSGTIWHFMPSSINGRNFTYWENFIVGTPAGPKTSPAWKTATGSCYTSVSLGPICSW